MTNTTDTPAPSSVLEQLRAGNERYSTAKKRPVRAPEDTQGPIAAVLLCSDIHANPEQVFGVAPGQLYLLQNAGNIVTNEDVEGVLRAREQSDVRLVVVLGHSGCRVLTAREDTLPPRILGEVRASKAKAQKAKGAGLGHVHVSGMAEAMRQRLATTDVAVAGAFLDEQSGRVSFL